MLWRRGKKRNEKRSDPVVHAAPSRNRSLFSSWFSKFRKSNRRGPDPEVDDVGSRSASTKDGGGEGGAMRELENVEKNFTDIKLNVKERQKEEKEKEKKTSFRTPGRIKTWAIPESREALAGIPSGNDSDRECPLKGRESQRKSINLTTPRRRSRHLKVSSPRLNSIVNARRSNKGRDSGEKDYERCAVVKSSYDPHGDFRKSMWEMIMARGTGGTVAEMEELLACYLMLNDDAYHDTIIKVFRQVWSELDGQGFRGIKRHHRRRPISSGY